MTTTTNEVEAAADHLIKAAAAREEGELLAKAFRESSRNGDGKPEGTRESLERCARMLDEHAPDCFPANERGQIHFARAMMESVADEIRAYLAGQSQSVNDQLLEACEWMIGLHDDPCPYDAGSTRAVVRQRIAAAKAEQIERALPATEEWVRELVGKNNCGRLYAGAKWLPEIRGIEQWVRLPENATRGDVIDLLTALKVAKT